MELANERAKPSAWCESRCRDSTILVILLQKDDMEEGAQLIEKVYVKLTEGTYPEGATKNEKRVIRRKAGTLDVVDGVLHYKRKDGRKVGLELQAQCAKLEYDHLTNFTLSAPIIFNKLHMTNNPLSTCRYVL